ncbi:phasin family protein [Chitinimonas sp.]|uniref:phasin family protein n=1 Tax=Chitinimonas sp. TaxID=1934313 RepID=UPI0035B0E643
MAVQANSELNQQQLEAALRMARITLDGAERLLHLQIDTVKQAVEDAARNAARLAEVKDVQSAMAVRAELTSQAAGNILDLSRNIYELAAQTQAELVRQAESQFGESHKVLMSGLGQFAPVPLAGGDLLGNALKSSAAATQAAYDSMTKAARQVAEFADASIKAASTATAAAAKGGSRK